MANLKSSKKDIRRIVKRTVHNRQVRTRLKTLQKKWNSVSSGDDPAAAKEVARLYVSALDKAAKKSIIHPNKASRQKSACARNLK